MALHSDSWGGGGGWRHSARHPNNVLGHCDGVVQPSWWKWGQGKGGRSWQLSCTRADGVWHASKSSYISHSNHSPEIWRMDDKMKNKWKAFFVGGNSGCRVHARSHFSIYKECCEAAGIKLHHHALPWKSFKAMKQESTAKGKGEVKQQSTLDSIVVKEKKVEFSCDDLLHEVAKFVACDDQVHPIAFWDCWIWLMVLLGTCSYRQGQLPELPCGDEAMDNKSRFAEQPWHQGLSS